MTRMSSNYIKKVAIVGAGGSVGSQVLKYMLERGTFEITVISRAESQATFPSAVIVKKGDYSSSEFLESALKGQDALVLTFKGFIPEHIQSDFIRAAAKAGVKWILPNEYSGDTGNKKLTDAVDVLNSRVRYQKEIEELGASNWIAVVANLWIDYGLTGGIFGVDILDRKATLRDNGTNPLNLSTLPQIGKAVDALLSLPVESLNPSILEPCISDYKNSFFYVRSLCVSPAEMVAAAQRATKTVPEDWEITHESLDEFIQQGYDMLAQGDISGRYKVLPGNHFKPGVGDLYYHHDEQGQAQVDSEKLGIPPEDLDQIVADVVDVLNTKGKPHYG